METYISTVNSKKEFLQRFNVLYTILEKKNRSLFHSEAETAETALFKRLSIVKNYLEKGAFLPSKKESYCNMLPYFEYNGGFEMMNSEIGKEATELLYFFVQQY